MKSIKLLSAEGAREELKKAREKKAEKDKKEQEKLAKQSLLPPEDPDQVAYREMLAEVYYSISSAIHKLEDSCSIRIGTRQHESKENARKRKSLESIKTTLRDLGYQTSWSHDQIEDDGFNREHYDELAISWNPSIRWNMFRS